MARKRKSSEPSLFALRCEECGEYMVSTESGYLACPRGHGKLALDAPPAEEPDGSWFGADPVPAY